MVGQIETNVSNVIQAEPRETTSDSHRIDPTHLMQSVILFAIATLGGGGNLCVLAMIIIIRKFRDTALTFIGHHCLIDAIKSLYCIIFATALVQHNHPDHCNVVGISYMIFTTASAYNLLAVVVNEEFHLIRRQDSVSTNHNYCCIVFGIFIVWFTSILINLGVAFLPGNPEYNADIGSCVFRYGIPRNLVLHTLWMVLIGGAIILSYIWLTSLHARIKNVFRKTQIQTPPEERCQTLRSESDQSYESGTEAANQNLLMLHIHKRRVVIYIVMITSFVVFWCPLFILTLCDPTYSVEPKLIYKLLTILAWGHSILTPLLAAIILHDTRREKPTEQLFVFHNQNSTECRSNPVYRPGYLEGVAMTEPYAAVSNDIITNFRAAQLLALTETDSVETSTSDIILERQLY